MRVRSGCTGRPPARSARGGRHAHHCRRRSCGRHPVGRRSACFAAQLLLAGESGRHPEDAAAGQDGFLRLVFRTRWRPPGLRGPRPPRSYPESRRMASSSSSCSGAPASQPAISRIRSGPVPVRTHRAISRSSASAASVSAGLSQRASSGHSGPHLLSGQAFEENLSRDHLPAGPGAQPWHDSAAPAGTEPSREAVRDLLGRRPRRVSGSARLSRTARPSLPPTQAGPRCRSGGMRLTAARQTGTGPGMSAAGPPRGRSECGSAGDGCTSSRPWRCAR